MLEHGATWSIGEDRSGPVRVDEHRHPPLPTVVIDDLVSGRGLLYRRDATADAAYEALADLAAVTAAATAYAVDDLDLIAATATAAAADDNWFPRDRREAADLAMRLRPLSDVEVDHRALLARARLQVAAERGVLADRELDQLNHPGRMTGHDLVAVAAENTRRGRAPDPEYVQGAAYATRIRNGETATIVLEGTPAATRAGAAAYAAAMADGHGDYFTAMDAERSRPEGDVDLRAWRSAASSISALLSDPGQVQTAIDAGTAPSHSTAPASAGRDAAPTTGSRTAPPDSSAAAHTPSDWGPAAIGEDRSTAMEHTPPTERPSTPRGATAADAGTAAAPSSQVSRTRERRSSSPTSGQPTAPTRR